MQPPFSKLLIANRGEIACRIIRTARRLGVRTVAVYSDADASALHVELADEAVRVGTAAPADSYLNSDAILEAARSTGAQAIHPGYGFLSENPQFVEAVEKAGLVFVGPSAKSISAMGLKDAAKRLMQEAGVPVVPGYHGTNQDPDFLAAEAEKIGFPVLIKARAGGGGKGMRRVDAAEDFAEALKSAAREGKNAFNDPAVLIEKYITAPRHIEVQVFGDSHGEVVHLFERDCSLQRRHQKVIEEAPAHGMTVEMRDAMTSAAVKAAKAIDYCGAGTIEFIADGSRDLRPDGFWFMEMNTRLQVEHPVTEAITGLDLVEWQLRVAAGEPLPKSQGEIGISGHAIEARLYAEDPANGFLPATGKIAHLAFSERARNDSGVRAGDTITPHYDPMIAKVITHGRTRQEAIDLLASAVRDTHVAGTVTNARFLAALLDHEGFRGGEMDTGLIDRDHADLIGTTADDTTIALAALVLTGIDPSATRAGWRLWGTASHMVSLELDGEPLERRIELHGQGRVLVSGGRQDVVLEDVRLEHDQISARLQPNHQRLRMDMAVWTHGATRYASLKTDGATHAFARLDPLAAAGLHGDGSDIVTAPMTGTIQAVKITPGDTVSKGDGLLIMEAMKMETTLTAPRDGTIAEVRCGVGDNVEGGAVLVTFEEDAA